MPMMFTPTAIPNKSPDVNSEKALLFEFDKILKIQYNTFPKTIKIKLTFKFF